MRELKILDQPTQVQLTILNDVVKKHGFPDFTKALAGLSLYPLHPTEIEIFQVNMGKMCNQTCKHCHVDASPHRTEIMTRETLEQCLQILSEHDIPIVDLTGGAPELNPNFNWFVEECSKLNKHTIVRCNLTIILENDSFSYLPEFYAKHKVEVVSSLPFYNRMRTDNQRGVGVFDKSIKALQLLNDVGYGKEETDLQLNLVYNPAGAFLPASQESIEKEFKKKLFDDFGIKFNHLFTITNMPINRFLDYLMQSGNLEGYMEKLVTSFNPSAAKGVMCRNTLSIGWDGYIYDCDFNQMLDLTVENKSKNHISNF
ncbi:MAG: arsenosugar biosynthesis radical SAM protein ArsS, partial [Bacteroidales bacterium]|nr:arsenosugar biosynthesis radical SAM protein ArsS [Bacteroidales bacterium]